MKIGIYTPYLDTLTGGELYMLSIAECLSRDNEVDIFWDDNTILEKASSRFNLDLGKVKTVENIFSAKFGAAEKFKKTLTYDRIIYLSDGSLPFLFPGKLIVHFQQPFKKGKVPIGERVKAMQARKIICNSHFTKEFIDKAFGVKSVVVYPPAQKIEPTKIKKNVILTVGRYHAYSKNNDFKKLGFLIDVFKKMYKDYKDWEFHIVTSVKDEDENKFKNSIGKEASSSIKIIKNADHKTIHDEYRHAKIYWHAAGFGEDLENSPERAEHFGMSTVEAMSAGCVPVVVSLGGQKEVVRDGYNGLLWATEDDLLINTIKLITDKALFEKMSETAIRSSVAFGKEKFFKEIREIIHS